VRELTLKQLQQSERGPRFENVLPEQIHGPQSNYDLSVRVFKGNPKRYYDLQLEYEYQTGQRPRPDDYYA
jgi:hypothetical protein